MNLNWQVIQIQIICSGLSLSSFPSLSLWKAVLKDLFEKRLICGAMQKAA